MTDKREKGRPGTIVAAAARFIEAIDLRISGEYSGPVGVADDDPGGPDCLNPPRGRDVVPSTSIRLLPDADTHGH
jgi:hypothetical protein